MEYNIRFLCWAVTMEYFATSLTLGFIVKLPKSEARTIGPLISDYEVPSDHSDKFSTTSPTNESVLNVCLLIESTPDMEDDLYEYRRAAAAINLAVEHANEFVLGPGLQLRTFYKTAGVKCDHVRETVVSAMEFMSEMIYCNVYIGPSCGNRADALYNIAAFQKIPVIGVPAASLENIGQPREEYPYLIRTSYSTDDVGQTLINFLKHHNYNHSTVFTDETEGFFLEQEKAMVGAYSVYFPDLALNSRFRKFRPSSNGTIDLDVLETMLIDANHTSRVFIILANASIVRQFMLLAHSMRMTDGNYLFMTVELFESNYWGKYTWKNSDLNEKDARQAYKFLAIVSLSMPETEQQQSFAKKLKERALQSYNYSYGTDSLRDPFVTGYYDAIILYAGTVQNLTDADEDYKNGSLVVDAMRNMTFNSPINGEVRMDEVGDRIDDYTVRFMDINTGIFEVIMIAKRYSEQDQDLEFPLNQSRRTWYDENNLPPDIPRCGFIGNNPLCRAPILTATELIAAAATPTILFIVVMIVTVIGIRSLRKNALDPFWWKISIAEIQVATGTASSSFGPLNSSVSLRTKTSHALSDDTSQHVAYYKGNLVNVRNVMASQIHIGSEFLKTTNQIKDLSHVNLHKIIGIAPSADGHTCAIVISEYTSKGSLQDVFANENINLDWSFKQSMIFDIAKGMEYIHASTLQSHGFLMERTCLVDGRFNIKITDCGLSCFQPAEDFLPVTSKDEPRDYRILLWRSPELLRQLMPSAGTQKGDVYGFAILLQQIILRSDPYDNNQQEAEAVVATLTIPEIVWDVKEGSQTHMTRPKVPRDSCPQELLYDLMVRCWSENPLERPTFQKIREMLRKIGGRNDQSIVDHLLARMEQYANSLEGQVAVRTQQFMDEKKRSEDLLGQLLPKSVAEKLTKGLSVYPESFDSATIFFSDIVGFTTISATANPMDVVELLNSLYTLFDGILENYDVYKVETIGDAYMVCSGLPIRNGVQHVKQIALMSLHLRRDIVTFKIAHKPDEKLQVRIGCHTGPCVAGTVGLKMPRYCLFGDTVNTASRMESSGEPMKIQITEATKSHLENIGGFQISERGEQLIKGKGLMITFWLDDFVDKR